MVVHARITGIMLLLVAIVLFNTGLLHAASLGELAGPPFSDPAVTQEMDSEWQAEVIKYDDPDKDADIVLSLNQQFYEFMLPYVRDYAEKSGLKIVVKRGTCGLSAGMLSNKKGDIGAFCCPPGKADRLPGLQYHTVGIHPIAILVHPDNPIEDLSLLNLRQIFKGDIVDWAELGWDNGRIEPVVRLHCKKRPGHWRRILDNEDLFGAGVREVGSIGDMFSLVETQTTSIGYEVLWLANREAARVKAIKIDGHHPDELDKVLTGEYPFYRALYLSTWEPEHLKNPQSRKLVDYIIKQVEIYGSNQGIIPAGKLRASGWKFSGDELIGVPE